MIFVIISKSETYVCFRIFFGITSISREFVAIVVAVVAIVVMINNGDSSVTVWLI